MQLVSANPRAAPAINFHYFDEGTDTDVWALEHNYVSVVPVQFDLTNYTLKSQLEKTNIFK